MCIKKLLAEQNALNLIKRTKKYLEYIQKSTEKTIELPMLLYRMSKNHLEYLHSVLYTEKCTGKEQQYEYATVISVSFTYTNMLRKICKYSIKNCLYFFARSKQN